MVTQAWSITTVSGYQHQDAAARLAEEQLAAQALVVMLGQAVAVADLVAVSLARWSVLSGAVDLQTASLLSGKQ